MIRSILISDVNWPTLIGLSFSMSSLVLTDSESAPVNFLFKIKSDLLNSEGIMFLAEMLWRVAVYLPNVIRAH